MHSISVAIDRATYHTTISNVLRLSISLSIVAILGPANSSSKAIVVRLWYSVLSTSARVH